jgi:hypothetical protein
LLSGIVSKIEPTKTSHIWRIMMNFLKKSLGRIKILALSLSFLSFLILCFPTAAMAAPTVKIDGNLVHITEKVEISGGSFDIDLLTEVPRDVVILEAKLSLPDGVTGTLKEIGIYGPMTWNAMRRGGKEFGCRNIKVQNGTDLIKECGGFAYLNRGPGEYVASGSGFGTAPNTTLKVDLLGMLR